MPFIERTFETASFGEVVFTIRDRFSTEELVHRVVGLVGGGSRRRRHRDAERCAAGTLGVDRAHGAAVADAIGECDDEHWADRVATGFRVGTCYARGEISRDR